MRVGVGWGGNEAHEVDEQLGLPEQDGFIAAAVWMLQDFATPSAGQRRPAGAWCQLPQPTAAPRRGNRDYGAGTPMPSRSARVPSYSDMRPEAAHQRTSSCY
jgi:hypothetical protein